VTYAEQQRDTLPAAGRRELARVVGLLAADPRQPGTNNKDTRLWAAAFGLGILIYSIEEEWATVTVLRATWVG
jgi:hypothetical protein